MDQTGVKLLNLMFREGETICVSPNKYGFHSVPLSMAQNGPVVLLSPNEEIQVQKVDSRELVLVALNPIKGYRQDGNCTAFRNFLVEMDYGNIDEQIEYIKRLRLPYSAIVFSGNKSAHVLISLNQDLPNENIYRKFSKWVLNIATAADQSTLNPSRSIRIPGAMRDTGKRQEIIEFKGAVDIKNFAAWLNKHPDAQPKEHKKKTINENPDLEKIPRWVQGLLINGLDPLKGRNQQWFQIACEYTLAGFSEDAILKILSAYFIPERDFTEREWETTIASAVRYTHDRRKND